MILPASHLRHWILCLQGYQYDGDRGWLPRNLNEACCVLRFSEIESRIAADRVLIKLLDMPFPTLDYLMPV